MTIRHAQTLAVLLVLAGSGAARADVLVHVDKTTQHMTVSVDGQERYYWPVSTGLNDGKHDTPSVSARPFRMEASHFSKEFDDAPMPHSMFFTQQGHAIHGTTSVRQLGRAASHGCVRLSPANAATLFALVKQEGMAKTRFVVDGEAPVVVAKASPRRPAIRDYGYGSGDEYAGQFEDEGYSARGRRRVYDPYGGGYSYRPNAEMYGYGYGYGYGY